MSGGGSLEALHWKLCFSPTRTVAFLGPSRITTPETKNRAHQWDGLGQERHTSNSSALAMELYLSCTNSSNGYCERQVTPGCLQIWQYSVLHSFLNDIKLSYKYHESWESKKLQVLMPWISNHNHKIEEKSTKSSHPSPKLSASDRRTCVGIGLSTHPGTGVDGARGRMWKLAEFRLKHV